MQIKDDPSVKDLTINAFKNIKLVLISLLVSTLVFVYFILQKPGMAYKATSIFAQPELVKSIMLKEEVIGDVNSIDGGESYLDSKAVFDMFIKYLTFLKQNSQYSSVEQSGALPSFSITQYRDVNIFYRLENWSKESRSLALADHDKIISEGMRLTGIEIFNVLERARGNLRGKIVELKSRLDKAVKLRPSKEKNYEYFARLSQSINSLELKIARNRKAIENLERFKVDDSMIVSYVKERESLEAVSGKISMLRALVMSLLIFVSIVLFVNLFRVSS